ncbi:MAG: nucleoside-diphosphate sugar epimerase/dehydratase, partial [Fusobacteriaceae bacterium]
MAIKITKKSEIIAKKVVKYIIDVELIHIGIISALMMSFESWNQEFKVGYFYVYILVYSILYLVYKIGARNWNYTNMLDVVVITLSNFFAFVANWIFFWFLNSDYAFKLPFFIMDGTGYSQRVFVGIFVFATSFQLLARLLFKLKNRCCFLIKIRKKLPIIEKRRALVYGAGKVGVEFLNEQFSNENFKYKVVGFIDDDKEKKNMYVYDVKVVGSFKKIKSILKTYNDVQEIIIAIPNIEKWKLEEIIKIMRRNIELKVRKLPTAEELLSGKNHSEQLTNINIEDLIGKE